VGRVHGAAAVRAGELQDAIERSRESDRVQGHPANAEARNLHSEKREHTNLSLETSPHADGKRKQSNGRSIRQLASSVAPRKRFLFVDPFWRFSAARNALLICWLSWCRCFRPD